MLAEMHLGKALTMGEVWPIRLAWLRHALGSGQLTRRQISQATGRERWDVDSSVWQAERLGLVRCGHVPGQRGGVWYVALVHTEA